MPSFVSREEVNIAIFAHGEKKVFREFKERDDFSQELTYTNYVRMRYFSLIIIAVVIIVMLILDLPNMQKGFNSVGNEYKVLFFLHLSTGLSMLVFFGLSWRKLRLQSTKFTRCDKLLNYLFNFMFVIICALFSVNDQRINGQITLYILGIYLIAIVNYHHPVRSLSIYISSYIIFVVGITKLQTNALLLHGYYGNSAIIIILAWFISNILYYVKKKDFLAEKALLQSEQRALALVEDLKKIDYQKNQFLNSLSHELRNPLASMMMSLSLIKLADPASAQVVRAMEIFERQTSQLSRLVDDLMEVTRITQNKIKLKIDLVELNSLVLRTVKDYKQMFVEKGISLEVKNNSQPVYVLADSTRLIQIIENLLYNALKFTNVGGEVQVMVSKDEGQGEAVLKVNDNGIGIKQELLEDLFLPFVQADISLDHSSGGVGLGLAIVKGMVDLHGGKVSAKSDGLGKGAQFIIQLPLEVNQEPQKSFKQEKDWKKSGKRRILVIDDIPDVAEILCSLLRYLGYEVVSALDGIKGLARAKEFQPDVIFCDIGLPGMNGYEVARNLRRDERLKDVYLIALSGYAQPEDIERSKEAGFNRHVAKPVDLAKLEQILEEDIQIENIQA